MKKKGFTLIELLAVIVILAIIALIATPIILKVIENSKRNALKDTTYALVEAAGNYIQMKEVKGQQIEWTINKITGEKYISFNLSNEEDVKELNVKGSVPKKGRVEVTSTGKTYAIAIEDKICAKKDYNDTLVNLLSLNTDDICMLTASTSDISSEEANDIISIVTKLNSKVEEMENKVSTIESETIDKIYPVGSIYISTDLDTVEKVEEKFGGEWIVYGDGRVLKSSTEEAGKTGGKSKIGLSVENIPAHTHSISHTHTTPATNTGNQSANHTHSIPALSGTAASAGSHSHNFAPKGSGLNFTIQGSSGGGISGIKANASSWGSYSPAHCLQICFMLQVPGLILMV